ncbi:beta-mannosidase [Lacrimispora celerecrescens]|uniref:Beta-mannosidase B n=1 Tax=[Clostridium] celerecrescens 18A TaxID=1286362 RepID=A0A2M8Z0Q8_9FIRM|nr:glycoside hydrolase family 2 protein [Lacrimispora celerecrescens]PJJ27026.1 beta-mannosidase [[Clostridium] celerecrescens 18A]
MRKTQSLNGIWEWHSQGASHDAVYTGEVPGTVISHMLEHKLIEDPYWRCNEYAVRELMANEYLYKRSFTVTEEDLEFSRAELVCDGLDTIATICINGCLVAETRDMHRTYRFPVREYLQKGRNRIEVLFHSPLDFVRKEDEENDIFYASTGCIHGNAALRKAHYMFGWDWGPQLPDMGIFRDIAIEYFSEAKIQDVHIRQEHEGSGRVGLKFEIKISQLSHNEERLENRQTWFTETEITDPEGRLVSRTVRNSGEWQYEETIPEPRIWWPNGLGEHPLYRVNIRLLDEAGTCHDAYGCRIGLRTVTVSTDKNKNGNEFAITVNGIKIFTMGANYIPEDNILTRVSKERTARLIKDCAAANFNCLRVWGGGYYPDNYFYDKCDEEGILIWQDLMFGCNVYALNDTFEEDIVEETKDNVRRLRHHACLALWCGNNEMEWGWADEWARLKGHHPRYKADYTKIFEYILPRAIRACDDTTFFWPSSPSSGGAFDNPNATNRGDQHYWEVWHSGKPFTEYGDFSFCSEYGFQSFPHSKTIASFTLPEDRNIFSRVMESHQKNPAANGKILNYIADYFLYPKDTDSLAYISQILQLKAIEYGVEHWRRKRGQCMGSLYWQLNDCWPVASWASIDYYGRWKALHYGARRFYAPFTISIGEEKELSPHVSYYVHNDTREEQQCRAEILLMDREFRVLWEESWEGELPALSVLQCIETDFSSWTDDEALCSSAFSVFRLYRGVELLAERTVLFVKPKHFEYNAPAYDVLVSESEHSFDITVKASCFCQYVELYFKDYDAVFSDNFFDITSPEGVTVHVSKKDFKDQMSPSLLKENLVVRSVADSYES